MRVSGDVNVLRLETRSCEPHKLSRLGLQCPTPHNGVGQLRTKRPVPNTVAQDGAIFSCEVRYDRLRRVLRNRLRGFALGDLYRQGVPFGGSIQIIYVDEPESREISMNGKSQ